MRECETKILLWGCGLNPSLYGMYTSQFKTTICVCMILTDLFGREQICADNILEIGALPVAAAAACTCPSKAAPLVHESACMCVHAGLVSSIF
jgi:hypothetical protein